MARRFPGFPPPPFQVLPRPSLGELEFHCFCLCSPTFNPSPRIDSKQELLRRCRSLPSPPRQALPYSRFSLRGLLPHYPLMNPPRALHPLLYVASSAILTEGSLYQSFLYETNVYSFSPSLRDRAQELPPPPPIGPRVIPARQPGLPA